APTTPNPSAKAAWRHAADRRRRIIAATEAIPSTRPALKPITACLPFAPYRSVRRCDRVLHPTCGRLRCPTAPRPSFPRNRRRTFRLDGADTTLARRGEERPACTRSEDLPPRAARVPFLPSPAAAS